MKILLVGEASGVHNVLRDGLREAGVQADVLGLRYDPQGRNADIYFCPSEASPSITRPRMFTYVTASFRALRFLDYDVVNFVLRLTLLSGHLMYFDIPVFKKQGVKLSYFGVGCSPVSIPRNSPDKDRYLFCTRCESEDELGKSCLRSHASRTEKAAKYATYFDYYTCCAQPYYHSRDYFPNAISEKIPLPFNAGNVEWRPAISKAKPRIVHAPSRRGFKGTSHILKVIESLRNRVSFDFELIEGLSYGDYQRRIADADIYIDQLDAPVPGMAALEALAMGKIVISGNMPVRSYFFDFEKNSPVVHGSSNEGELDRAIEFILDNKYQWHHWSEQGRDYVLENHDYRKVARQFIDLWSGKTHEGPGHRDIEKTTCAEELVQFPGETALIRTHFIS